MLADGNARFVAREPQIGSVAAIEDLWVGIGKGQSPFADCVGLRGQPFWRLS